MPNMFSIAVRRYPADISARHLALPNFQSYAVTLARVKPSISLFKRPLTSNAPDKKRITEEGKTLLDRLNEFNTDTHDFEDVLWQYREFVARVRNKSHFDAIWGLNPKQGLISGDESIRHMREEVRECLSDLEDIRLDS